MNHMKIFRCLLLFWVWDASGQKNDSLRCELASLALNRYLPAVECDYFFPEKPFDPEQYVRLHPDSLYTFFDPETYEGITMTGAARDSLYQLELPRLKVEYEKDLASWTLREQLGKKVILVGATPAFRLRDLQYTKSERFPGYENLVSELRQSGTTPMEVEKINADSTFLLLPHTPENEEKYTYATAGYVWFSDAVANGENTKAVLHFSTHYMIGRHRPDRGVTGFGVLLFFKKENGVWRMDKSLALWEE